MAEVIDMAAAERAHRLEQRARSFRIRRDRYLEPIVDQSVIFRDSGGDEFNEGRMQGYLGFGPPVRDFFSVYGPKDGDYQNLQRFSSSLVRFRDRSDELDDEEEDEEEEDEGLCLFLALPQGGLAVLNWLGGLLFVDEVVFNGATYSRSTQYTIMSVQSLDFVAADIYLPPGETISRHGADLDTVLSFMTSLIHPKNVCLCESVFTMCGNWEILPISNEIFQSSMESLVLFRSKLCLNYMRFSEEQGQILQSLPFQAIDISSVALRTQFLHQAMAKAVTFRVSNIKDLHSAFTGLGKRQQPIGVVDIRVFPARDRGAIVMETKADADILLGALVGVSEFTLREVKTTPSVWAYIWRKIRRNKNLLSMNLYNWPDMELVVGSDCC